MSSRGASSGFETGSGQGVVTADVPRAKSQVNFASHCRRQMTMNSVGEQGYSTLPSVTRESQFSLVRTAVYFHQERAQQTRLFPSPNTPPQF